MMKPGGGTIPPLKHAQVTAPVPSAPAQPQEPEKSDFELQIQQIPRQETCFLIFRAVMRASQT